MAEEQRLAFVVAPNATGQRLDFYLCAKIDALSRSQVKRLIERGKVLLNEKPGKAGVIVRPGDVVQVALPSPQQTYVAPRSTSFDIIHEDSDLIVLDKPAGLVVHPGAGTREPTLSEGLIYYLRERAALDEDYLRRSQPRFGIVHRLDRDTSGVMVCAKSWHAHEALARQFREKSNLREYVALLDGVLKTEKEVIESYLYRDPHQRMRFASLSLVEFEALSAEAKRRTTYRRATSFFRRLRVFDNRLTLVAVQLSTGRTHQIRVHARAMNLPVVGDRLYHRPVKMPAHCSGQVRQCVAQVTRQLLHARLIGFMHPTSGQKMAFEAPIPTDFQEVIDVLAAFSEDLP